MINQDSLNLLDLMESIEISKFTNNEKGLGFLQKQSRIQDTFKSILSYVQTINTENGIYSITNTNRDQKTHSMFITLIREEEFDINDHTRHFLITLSSSCETYKVEELNSHERVTKTIIKNFDPKRL